MGHIEDALRKAKAMREGARDASTDTMPNIVPGPVRVEPGQKSAILMGDLANKATRLDLDVEALEKSRVIAESHPSGPTTAYKMLRTRMLQRMRTNNWTRIAVSSARTNAGKTLTAINTAISLAQEPNQRVILVDLDLRRPSVSKYLGIEHKYGLSDYLLGNVPLESVVVQPNIDRLLIVPNKERFDDSSEMLSSPQMSEFVSKISHRANSSIVVFDLPPLLEADDLLAFSPQADALLLVVAEGETRRADLQKSVDLIQGLNVLGYILNKSRSEDHAAGYY